MYSKASVTDIQLDPATAETLADLLYEIGKELLVKKQFESATKWLERSYAVITRQDVEELRMDAGELRVSIMHSLGV